MLIDILEMGFVSDKILKFTMSPEELAKLLIVIFNNRRFNIQIARITKTMFSNPHSQNINAEFGRFLDRVSFPIFVDG